MLSWLETYINQAKDFLWNGPLLFSLIAVGLYQTWQLRGIQFRHLTTSFRLIFKFDKSGTNGDISTFQSLMTALAGSIGTGNITGIATAVSIGGLGSLFWMWVMATIGMATAYSESILALTYRRKNENGEMSGGPMYTLLHGLNSRKLAVTYALFAGVATIGIGCLAQSNSMIDAIDAKFAINRLWTGIILALITGLVVIGGVKKIGKVAGYLVPAMAAIYLVAGIVVILYNFDQIPYAFSLIFSSAFSGQAAVGGFAGSTLSMALQNGVQFGIFANEAGLGSLAIASASAKTDSQVEHGMRAMGGVFCATMIVCTITGLVLAVTNVIGLEQNGILIKGSPLAMAAFATVTPSFNYIVLFGLILFSFTTMLAWAYYGEKCFEFIFGERIVHHYRWMFIITVVLGAVVELDLVWAIANFVSALMAFPNLISIIALGNIVANKTDIYLDNQLVGAT